MLLGATFCQNMIVYGIPIEMINVFIKRLEIKHFIAMLNYILFITQIDLPSRQFPPIFLKPLLH